MNITVEHHSLSSKLSNWDISSVDSSKSKSRVFAAIRPLVDDLGSGMNPCSAHATHLMYAPCIIYENYVPSATSSVAKFGRASSYVCPRERLCSDDRSGSHEQEEPRPPYPVSRKQLATEYRRFTSSAMSCSLQYATTSTRVINGCKSI